MSALLALMVGNAANAQAADCAQPSSEGFVGGDQANADSVIVFVHGLGGDAIGTWTSGWLGWKTYWPCMVRLDKAFAGNNVNVYEYSSALLSGATPVGRLATQLYADLRARGVFRHSHVTFVAHSLGGLVVSRMLLDMHGSSSPLHRADLARTRHVMFYGTPAAGNELASLLKLFGDSQQVRDIADQEAARDTARRWNAVQWGFSHTCLAEGADQGVWPFSYRVVPRDSALALCSTARAQKADLDQFNHLSMVKPSGVDQPPHRRLATDFALCVKPRLRGRDAVDESSSEGGKKAVSWYEQLVDQWRRTDGGTETLQAWLQDSGLWRRPGLSNAFVVPRAGRTGTTADDYELVRGRAEVAQEFVRQALPRLALEQPGRDASVDAVVSFAKLHDALPDRSVIDLQGHLTRNSAVAPTDWVIMAGMGGPGRGERVMLFVGPASDTDPALKLRGFLLVAPDIDCTAMAAVPGSP